MADKPADTRTPEQIRAAMAARRARMSANVEGLVTEVHPTAVKNRAVDDAKTFAATELHNAKTQIKDEDGWRSDRLMAAGAAVAGAVGFLLIVRSLIKKN